MLTIGAAFPRHVKHLDDLMLQRRSLTDERRQAATKAAELGITMQRFFQLNETYTSDLRRLAALEEGGLALMAMTGRECPVCGASTTEQRHHHADDEIELVRRSAKAELSKIMIEQADLRRTMTSLAQDESRFAVEAQRDGSADPKLGA
jgi:hypothetical protein